MLTPRKQTLAVLCLLCCSANTSVFAEATVIDAAKFESIHEAVAAIPPQGGLLRLPPGEIKVHRPVHITTPDTRIEGAGTATHIINTNEEGQPAFLLEHADYADKATPSADRLWRISLANLRITGNEKSGAGIDARYIEELFIQGVTSSYHGGDGLRMTYCYEDPRICDNLFTYNNQCGIHIDGCHDIIVSANQLEENQDGVRCIDSFNLAMSGNNLDDHLGDGVVIENTYGSIVSSNMIEECNGWAIVLDRDCYGITLSANVIAHEFSGGVDLRDAHGCSVSANTFTIVKKTALAVRSKSGSITITGNNFSDSRIGVDAENQPVQKRPSTATNSEDNPNEASGIVLEDCKGVVISGNLFSGLTSEPVTQTAGCTQILLQGNGVVVDH